MSAGYGGEALVFLLRLGFGLFLVALVLRLMLQWVGASFHHPLSQLVVRVTHPLLRQLRRFLPAVGRMDTATLVALLLVQAMELLAIAAIAGAWPKPLGLLVMSVAELLGLTINVYLVLLVVRAVLSFVDPYASNPLALLTGQLTEPLLQPLRRVIPPAGGFDWSVLLAFVVLQLLQILLLHPLRDLGASLW